MRIETSRLYIRQLNESDFDLMSSLWSERFPPLLLENKSEAGAFLLNLWEGTQTPSILTGLIFLRNGDVFCGRVNMQNIGQEVPEVGIDILRNYQNAGYGMEAVTGFVNWYWRVYHISEVKVRISSKNARSIHLFEKIGSRFVAEELMFPEQMQAIRESLPENNIRTFEDMKVRKYLLKLPV